MTLEGSRSSWEPIDLRELEPRLEQTTPRRGGILYCGGRHALTGESETAKTTVAYALGIEEIRDGGVLFVLDFEMGEYEARNRLLDMGATDEELGMVTYIRPEDAPPHDCLPPLIKDRMPKLAIIDAAAGAYNVLGLDDGKRQDVEAFNRILVRPFHTAGVTTIVIDHVTKAKDGRSRYAIGSERKLGVVDVSLGLEAIRPFQRGRSTLVHVVTHKDRFGFLHRPRAAEIELVSDPDTHRISWTFREPADTPPDEWRPTALMAKISALVEQQSEPVSHRFVLDARLGKRDYVRAGIRHLVSDGYMREDRGPRGALLLSHLRPFPDRSPTVLGNGDPSVPPFPPPTAGNGNGQEADDVEWWATRALQLEEAQRSSVAPLESAKPKSSEKPRARESSP